MLQKTMFIMRMPCKACLLFVFALQTQTSMANTSPGDILATDNSVKVLFTIDPATGDRTILSSPFLSPRGIAVESGGSILVADSQVDTIYRVDPTTGGQTIVSSSTVGSGPSFGFPVDVAVESDGNIVVADVQAGAIYRVDPTTGNRTIVSSSTVGTGPAIVEIRAIVVESNGNILVGEIFGGIKALYRVDPTTGDRTIVSSSTVGSGPDFGFPAGLALESNGDILVFGVGPQAVFRVDPATGDRTIVSSSTVGSGLDFIFVGSIDIAVSGSNGNIIVPDPATDTVLSVDPATGDRTIVSGLGVGSGPNLSFAGRVAVVPPPTTIPVTIDIKPGSDPNSINLCSNGAVPVAILGSNTFDVLEIDTETLRFAEASIKVVGRKDPNQLCSYEDINGDFINDLVCHYVTTDIAGIDGESTSATVNGELLDGTAIEGTDSVNIVKDTCN